MPNIFSNLGFMSKSLRHILFFCLLLTWVPKTYAQLDRYVYCADSAQVDPKQKYELRFTVDALTFFRDNEYNSKELLKGYTLPGMWLSPTVSYQALHNLRVEVGAFMLHFWGANRYPNANYSSLETIEAQRTSKAFHCVPIFRANLQLTPQANIVLGTLYGKTAHELCTPLYNDEMNLTSDPETGVQILWHPQWMKFDAWIDWQDFIFQNDHGQERFAFGLSTRFLPSRRTARAKWHLPLQIVMKHTGGEINTEASDRSIKTWLNAAAGAGVDIPLPTRHVPVTLSADLTATYFSQQSGNVLPFDKGYGLLAQVGAHLWHFGLSAAWWQSHKFIPIYGSTLFSSMSTSTASTTLTNPRAFLFHGEYAQPLARGFSWGVALDYMLHNEDNIIQVNPLSWRSVQTKGNFSAGIYLRLSPSFLIKKFHTAQTR